MSGSKIGKRILKILLVFIALIIAAIITIPMIYKSEIIELVKEEANKNIKGELGFGDFDLSLISSFPNLNLEINEVSLLGIDEFEETYLSKVESLTLEINLFRIISTGKISIQSIRVDHPQIHIKVLENGKANYDITYPTTEEDPIVEESSSPSTFEMALDHYEINDGAIHYDDESLAMSMVISNLNHSGSGNFTSSIFNLNTKTHIDALTFTYEGIPYLYEVETDLQAIIGMDLDQMLFSFKENLLSLNKLPLEFSGHVAMPSEAIDMDLSFGVKDAGFKELLSLVPAIYQSDMEGLNANGNLNFIGFAKGSYTETTYPAFGTSLSLNQGQFQYVDLPTQLNNASIDMKVNFPGGEDLDAIVVDLKKFAATIENNPISASFKLTKPMTSMDFEAKMKGIMDFDKLSSLIPLEEEEKMSGILNIDANIKGDMASIEKEQYEKILFNGFVDLSSFSYKSTLLPDPIAISKLNIKADQKKVNLNSMEMNIGKSDVKASGNLNNFIAYALNDKTLKGELSITSNLLNIDALMPTDFDEEPVDVESSDEEMILIEVPKNLDLSMNLAVEKMVYDDIDIDQMKGAIIVKNGKAELKDLRMKILKGQIAMNGAYATPSSTLGEMDFDFKLLGLDLNEMANTFNSIAAFAPIAKYSQGLFNAAFSLKGNLDGKMNPVLNSLNGAGDFFSKSIGIKGFKPLSGIGKALQLNGLDEQTFKDVAIKYSFSEGKMNVEPFEVKLAGTNAKIKGTTGIDQSIDYTVNLEIPSKLLAGNTSLTNLLGSNNSSSEIDVAVLVGGTILKPTIKTSLKDLGKNIVDGAKDKAKEAAQEQLDEAKEKAQEALNKKADQLVEEANKQANAVRLKSKETADQLRKEAKKQGDKLISDAGSNILKKRAAELAAKKLQSEAEEKAKRIESEGDIKANAIVTNAEEKANKLRNP